MAVVEMVQEIVQVPLADLRDSPYQPREDYGEEALAELTNSIRENGILTPLTVRVVGDHYELIGGHRRSRAARRAGLEVVPCIVHDVADDGAQRLALIDNLSREDLLPWEEGTGYHHLRELSEMSVLEIARAVGKSEGFVRGRMELSEHAGEALRAAYMQEKVNLEAMLAAAKLPCEVLEVKTCPQCGGVCRANAEDCSACGADLRMALAWPVGNPQEVAAKALAGVPTWGVGEAIGRIEESYGLADEAVQTNMGLFGMEVEQLSEHAATAKTKLERLCEQVARLEGWWTQNSDVVQEYSRDQLEAVAAKLRVVERVTGRIGQAVADELAG